MDVAAGWCELGRWSSWAFVGILVVLGGAGGCAVGPDYRKPQVQVPVQYSEAPGEVEPTARGDLSRWWTVFQDPLLEELIQRAIRQNLDLQIAESRVREARAQRGVVAAGAYPAVNVAGAYTRSLKSGDAPSAASNTRGIGPAGDAPRMSQGIRSGGDRSRGGAGSGSDPSGTADSVKDKSNAVGVESENLFVAGFDAGWELDLFGRVRRSVEAADAEIGVYDENRRAVLVSLLAEVAVNYVELRGTQYRLDLTKGNITIQEQTVELTTARFSAGLNSELDVAQAKAQLATTESRIPALETSIRYAIHRLSVLLGQEPGALSAELTTDVRLPKAPPEVPVGLPSDLLRRRPDIREAERALAAATARIGVATADLFPRFSLTGSVGSASIDAADFLSGGSRFWSLGPSLRWPVFDAGRIRANIEVQNARQEQALLRYEKVILTSLEDVENALVAYTKEYATSKSLAEAEQANRKAFDIATELYSRGLVDFLNVLQGQAALFNSQDQLAQSEQRILTDLITLFKALGGGWDVPSPA